MKRSTSTEEPEPEPSSSKSSDSAEFNLQICDTDSLYVPSHPLLKKSQEKIIDMLTPGKVNNIMSIY